MIEIKGVSFQNKGAELMLRAVLDLLRKFDIKEEIAIAPEYNACMYKDYSRLGLYQKIWLRYKGIQWGSLGTLIPKKLRELYGLVTDKEIDVVLDASGFAYSDQWGGWATKQMAKSSKKWKKRGKKIILLPQAFGPFNDSKIKKYVKEIIDNSNLIYARDEISYEYLTSIVGIQEKIKIVPDFTMVIDGVKPQYINDVKNKVCVVPNKRMIDKVSGESYSKYSELLAKIIRKLQEKEIESFILIHGGTEDFGLAKKIIEDSGLEAQIINESDVLVIKGIIGNSLGLIGSRFHSLATAMYCGKVAIGTGWSHKYNMLYKEFEFEDGIIDLDITDSQLDRKLAYITDAEMRNQLAASFLELTNKQKQHVHNMFEEIADLIKK
ncbi:MAG: polysaccharide pyruvyl transferase family protein [Deltaproteobacteria bacterium]|nr:MAG: polysaccharide pyruvyl transferase family protein [Deltaproteobacteria bacterium]